MRHSAASLSVRRTTYATCRTRGASPPADLLGVDLDPGRVAQVALGDPRDRRSRWWPRRAPSGVRSGVAARIVSRSSAKPMSSISSASSRIDHRDLVEAQAAALEVIDRATRGRDHDVDAAAQAAELLADRLAAVDRQDAGAQLAPVGMERLRDLHRELPGGNEDERRGGALAGAADRDPLEHRQGEGRGLAGARRRLGEQVAAGQQRRDRLALDGRRLLVAEGGDRAQQPAVELEPAEPVAGRLDRVHGWLGRGRCVSSRRCSIVVRASAVSGPRRPARGRSSGRGACRRHRSGPWRPG